MDVHNKLAVFSKFFKSPEPDKWRAVVEAGITDSEMSVTHGASPKAIIQEAEPLYRMMREGGSHITSIHLPFGGIWDISKQDTDALNTALAGQKAMLDWAGEKGIGIAVLHPSAEPVLDNEREARLQIAAGSISALSDYAKTNGIALAVENLPRTCLGNTADEMLRLTDIGKTARLCMDVNHLLKETHEAFIAKTGPYIITTHFSDYDRIDERHWIPGAGCIDWKEIVDLLSLAGYKGRFLFELDEMSDPRRDGSFTPAELVARFKACIKG